MSKKDDIRQAVIKKYSEIVNQNQECGCSPSSSCCGSSGVSIEDQTAKLGYSPAEVGSVPQGANLGLGCGNPQAIAGLQPGEVVLDLGAGGGLDCFLAARQVGESGKVIGVDMTAEMVARAREHAEREGFKNIEFRLGEIEHLPVGDASVDVIISNCVVNLTSDKEQVYREAFRVLRPGGRLAILDTVRIGDFPKELRDDPDLYCSCITGAAGVGEIEGMLAAAGFEGIAVRIRPESREFIKNWSPDSGAENMVASAEIQAVKPKGK